MSNRSSIPDRSGGDDERADRRGRHPRRHRPDPTTLDDSTLGTEILQIELALRRLQGAKADRLRVFDARDAAVADGLGTAATWLAARTGNTGLKTARAEVSLGRDLARATP